MKSKKKYSPAFEHAWANRKRAWKNAVDYGKKVHGIKKNSW